MSKRSKSSKPFDRSFRSSNLSTRKKSASPVFQRMLKQKHEIETNVLNNRSGFQA